MDLTRGNEEGNQAGKGPRVVAATLFIVFLVPVVAGAAWGMGSAVQPDRRQLVEVLHTADAEPSYVAGVLRDFDRAAQLQIVLVEVASPEELIERIGSSQARQVIVVAHGSSPYASRNSGVDIGDGWVPRGALEEAVAASGAGRFFFAVCGLALPETIAGKPVVSFEGVIDMKVAAVSALTSLGEIYGPQTITQLYPLVEKTIWSIAPEEEMIQRIVSPVDPLGKGYCYSKSKDCEWDSNDEKRMEQEAQNEGGLAGRVGRMFTDKMGRLGNNYVGFYGDDCKFRDHRWDFLVLVQFYASPTRVNCNNSYPSTSSGCLKIFSGSDMVLPGVTQALRIVNKIPGVKISGGVLDMHACGYMYGGLLNNGNAAGGGTAILQVGTKFDVTFGWGWFSIRGAGWIVLTFEIGVFVQGQDSYKTFAIDFRLNAWVYVGGQLGWIKGSATWHVLSFQRRITVKNPFATGASAEDDYVLQSLTQANLNAIRSNPEASRRLSEALGMDVADVPAGSVLNLKDPAVFRALYPEDEYSNGVASTESDAAADECATTGVAESQPVGDVTVTACAHAESAESVGGGVGFGNSGHAVSDTAKSLGADPRQASAMTICLNMLENDDAAFGACHKGAMAGALPSVFTGKVGTGVKGGARVDYKNGNASAFVNACAAEGAVCSTVGGGLKDLKFPLFYSDPAFPGGARSVPVNLWTSAQVSTQVTSGIDEFGLGPGAIAEDVTDWAANL